MKQYNFDEVIDRRGTDCYKVDQLEERFGRKELLSLWVADMDFRTPDFIVEAIKERCTHEVFGYTYASDAYYNSIIHWLAEKHQWRIEREWLSYIPGIVKGIAFTVDCFTQPGDKVIIQSPVYHPFRLVPEALGREVADNPLRLADGTYRMDFEQLESIIDSKCKLLILCNPHNPGGMVWDTESLQRLAAICVRNNILVVSDEIHAEMVYPGYKHCPFPAVSEAAASCSISFMAPSKTFNIAGIVTSYAIIPNPEIREKFYHFLETRELGSGTIFAYEATRAAYRHGREWLEQLMAYITGNLAYIEHFIQEHIPDIKVYRPQASFLVWLDCRGLRLPQKELVALFVEKAGLALNDGTIFGPGGEGYMRLNMGCPRSILEQAMDQLKNAIYKK